MIAVVGAALVLLSTHCWAHPETKVADLHDTINKKRAGNNGHWHSLLKHVDDSVRYASSVVSPTSSFKLSRIPAFSDASSAAASKTKRTPLRNGDWKFVLDDDTKVALKKKQTQQQKSLVSTITKKQNPMETLLKQLMDDWNWKGYGISLYKSILTLKQCGIAFRIPLINNWDWWDSNPALPSLTLMICMYYPLNISWCVTSSMNVVVLKCWLAQGLLLLRAGVWKFLHHVWSALWTILSVLLYPVQQKWRPAPLELDRRSSDALTRCKERLPAYKSDIQERLGVSYWCRWRPVLGIDTRVSMWHLYMPTLEVYSQLLTGSREKLFGQWWKSHFASFGLDSGLTSLSEIAVLSLSGLRPFKKKKTKVLQPIDTSPLEKSEESKTTKTTLSTLLMEDERLYDDDEDYSQVRLKKSRGSNITQVVSSDLEKSMP
jgi:hypothetical protein